MARNEYSWTEVLEIFLDDAIFPAIKRKLHPLQDTPEEVEAEIGEQAEGTEDAEAAHTQ